MLKKPLPLAALFILTNALYFWMASRTLPALMAFAGGLPPLDTLPFGYAPDYPARLFAALGEAGRDYYRAPQLILDSFYPLLFALTYAKLRARSAGSPCCTPCPFAAPSATGWKTRRPSPCCANTQTFPRQWRARAAFSPH